MKITRLNPWPGSWLRLGSLTVAAAACGALLVSCSGYNEQRGWGDAPVGSVQDGPAEVVNMPNEFGNVATKCDGHGHRLYVVTHSRSDAPVVVIDDPSCPGGATR